jgi:hypothetical protein
LSELIDDSIISATPDITFLRLICQYLAKNGPDLTYEDVSLWLRLALPHITPEANLSPLAIVIAAHPGLLAEFPTLDRPELYDKGSLLVLLAAELAGHQDSVELLHRLRTAIEKHHGVKNWSSSRDTMMIVVRQMFKISEALDKRRAETRRNQQS